VSLLESVRYYQDHEVLLTELLDKMAEEMQPQPGDIPAYAFATLTASFERDPAKAVTIAALAIMRLGEIKRAEGGASCES
jgi:hypothetical protein